MSLTSSIFALSGKLQQRGLDQERKDGTGWWADRQRSKHL